VTQTSCAAKPCGLVEAVEVEVNQLGGEAVGLRFCHDELARAFSVG
jgi:hypothetical protein